MGEANLGAWKSVAEEKPQVYRNVLVAFVDHWNQVVAFYCGKDRNGRESWCETSAHDYNSPIKAPMPTWWTEIPQVPHYAGLTTSKPTAGRAPSHRLKVRRVKA